MRPPSVRVVPFGPLEVPEGVPLHRLRPVDQGPGQKPRWELGERLDDGGPYRLCRCSRTATPPYCDREPGVRCHDLEDVRSQPLPVTWSVEAEGPILMLKPNGPVRALGVPLERADYVAAEGATPGSPAPLRVSLCRCGATGAAPFCDGSHKSAGFRG